MPHGCQGHHHSRMPLIAGNDPHNALRGGQTADQTAQHHGGIVAEGQAVHHTGLALHAPVTVIGEIRGKGNATEAGDLLGRVFGENIEFPLSGTVRKGDRGSILPADTALRGQDKKLFLAKIFGSPAHADVFRPAEYISAGRVTELFSGKG